MRAINRQRLPIHWQRQFRIPLPAMDVRDVPDGMRQRQGFARFPLDRRRLFIQKPRGLKVTRVAFFLRPLFQRHRLIHTNTIP